MADPDNPLVLDEDTIRDEDRVSDSDEGEAEDNDNDNDNDNANENEGGENGIDTPGAGSSSSASKKKKKKRAKAAKILRALKSGKDDIPQTLVDTVMARVREEHGEGAPGTDEETVRRALEELKIKDVIKGKAGIAGRGKKDMGEHKVRYCSGIAFIDSSADADACL